MLLIVTSTLQNNTNQNYNNIISADMMPFSVDKSD